MKQYRIIPGRYFGFYLQFNDPIKIFGRTFNVWKYIPENTAAEVFSEKACPFYLPAITSHCYLMFLTKKAAERWAKNHPTLDGHFKELKSELDYKNTITYL